MTQFRKGAALRDRQDFEFLRRKRPMKSTDGGRPIRLVDLFSGCGAMTLGVAEAARRAGRTVDVRWAIDTDARASQVFRSNFQTGAVQAGDVADQLSFPSDGSITSRLTRAERALRSRTGPVSIVVGGPPCQGHSDLNNHTRRSDPRNQLYLAMARAARVLEPDILVIENVPAVVNDRGRVVNRTREALMRLHYGVVDSVVSLERCGVPQTRKRHVLVAHRDVKLAGLILRAVTEGWLYPESQRTRTVEWAIGDLWNHPLDGDGSFGQASHATAENQARMRYLINNDEYYLPNHLRPQCHHGKHSYKSVYGRLRWDEPAQTITTGFGSMGQGCFVHPKGPRTISPREAARIQTIPDYFSFRSVSQRTAWARMIGNAVPPLFMTNVTSAWLMTQDS